MKTDWIKLLVCLSIFPSITRGQDADLLIRNGRIIDGTGNPWYYGDIAVKQNRILSIGRGLQIKATKTIDAGGMYVAPGFIDVHTHIEDDERQNPTADNFIYDGVTTVITGNCGLSVTDIGAYLHMIDSLQPSVNVAALIGHNNVRRQVMGNENRQASEEELQTMEYIVDSAMQAGAAGFSTGLIYIPGTYANTNEIIRLARVAARYGGVYATHMRNEGDSVEQAIEEALLIGREANIPVEISHFKVGGQRKPGKSAKTLALVEKARSEGLDVTIDQYPYTASSTSLSSMLPSFVLAGPADSAKTRLKDPAIRKEVLRQMRRSLKKRGRKHYDYAMIASFTADSTYNGLSIEQVNRLKGRRHKAAAEANTILDLFEQGGASMVFHGMWEEDVQRILKYPFNMIASDASIRIFNKGVPHPRGYGSNARVLGKYVREQKLIGLEEAVRRMSSLPATKFHLQGRGLLLPGMFADILVFDAGKVQDLSTYERPHAYSTGFNTVIVNGVVVVQDGKHTGARSGIALRHRRSTANLTE